MSSIVKIITQSQNANKENRYEASQISHNYTKGRYAPLMSNNNKNDVNSSISDTAVGVGCTSIRPPFSVLTTRQPFSNIYNRVNGIAGDVVFKSPDLSCVTTRIPLSNISNSRLNLHEKGCVDTMDENISAPNENISCRNFRMENQALFNKYDKVQHLKTERTDWTIRVRAQAVWKGINRMTQEFRGLNVIFIDDSNSRIHAFFSAKICDLFPKPPKEGGIYGLSNFHVRVYNDDEKNRAVRFAKHIYFANHTQLTLEEDNITNIAPYAFDLYELNNVKKFSLILDVVGIIEDCNMKCVWSREDESKMHIKFRITDAMSAVNVTFFNTLAEDLEKELKNRKKEPVTIIIACAKVNEHEGALCLNNYPATRFYLNTDHYSVKLMKERLLDPTFSIKEKVAEEGNAPPIFSVADIKKLPKEYAESKVRCQITVKKVEQKTNRYDYVCTSCGEEVDIVEGRYKCLKCVRNIPYPDKRFRLATMCNDTTGILAIVFPDDEIQRILGKNAFDVADEIGERNLNKSSNIYTAIELNDPVESLGNHSPKKVEPTQVKDKSLTMEIDETIDILSSPPTAKSSNKVRTRNKNQFVPYEMEDNVPISKYKVVKIEKEFLKYGFGVPAYDSQT
ncbi:hypothetical protein POM88_034855 [Heracleum sosnowskyi]|uniref:Replication protein A 70 kDa DNA-binding subunit B/D first OB fold domain-containing protein n=1 Tax=Heracleum sosnowskyi TaxID=360622 RepID=A0AAD8ME06_9APIA|nr:hypothetical protein POM88_034855 [Heracleum sosnowskyi]